MTYLPHLNTTLCRYDKKTKSEANHMILKQISEEEIPGIEVDVSIFQNWIFGLIAVLVTFAILLFSSIWRSLLAKKEFERKESEWLESYRIGQENLIDWNEDIVFQAEYLPYRSEYEYPLEKLCFGKKIGSGEFGVVYKAIAQDLSSDGCELEVAVKKSITNKISEVKAFADELKIMMYIQNVNKDSH